MFHFKCNSSCARPSRRFSYTEEHNASLVHNTIIEFVISAVYYYLLVQQSFPSLDLFPHGQIIFAVLWKKSAFRFILQMCHDCCDHMIGRGEGACTGGQSVLLNFSKEIRLVFPFWRKNSRLNYDGTMILFLR